jgi:hypothetical protein
MIHAAKIAIKSEYMLSSSSSFFSQPIAHLGHRSSPNARAQGVRVLGHPFEAGRQGGDGRGGGGGACRLRARREHRSGQSAAGRVHHGTGLPRATDRRLGDGHLPSATRRPTAAAAAAATITTTVATNRYR